MDTHLHLSAAVDSFAANVADLLAGTYPNLSGVLIVPRDGATHPHGDFNIIAVRDTAGNEHPLADDLFDAARQQSIDFRHIVTFVEQSGRWEPHHDIAGAGWFDLQPRPLVPLDLLVALAEKLGGLHVEQLVSFAWVTIGILGPPVHLEVDWVRNGQVRSDYLYPEDFDDDLEGLVKVAFEGREPDSWYDGDRAEWLYTIDHAAYAAQAGRERRQTSASPIDIRPTLSGAWRQAAVEAVKLLAPELSRATQFTVVDDHRTDLVTPARQASVQTVLGAYRTGTCLTQAVAVLVPVLNPDIAVTASPDRVVLTTSDGTSRQVDATNWSVLDGAQGPSSTGLPTACSDPLRIARRLVATITALLG